MTRRSSASIANMPGINTEEVWLKRVPSAVRFAHAAWKWSLAWSHRGGVVFRLESPAGEMRFLKLTAGPRAPRLQPEAERLRWAQPYLPVPKVLDSGSEAAVD